jgi:hypothetical protein
MNPTKLTIHTIIRRIDDPRMRRFEKHTPASTMAEGRDREVMAKRPSSQDLGAKIGGSLLPASDLHRKSLSQICDIGRLKSCTASITDCWGNTLDRQKIDNHRCLDSKIDILGYIVGDFKHSLSIQLRNYHTNHAAKPGSDCFCSP